MPVQIDSPLGLEGWRGVMSELDGDTAFHCHASAFQGGATITEELKRILEHFGEQCRTAIYAIRRGMIDAVWIDECHNYAAIVFTEKSGDPGDFVSILSIGGPAPPDARENAI